MPRNPVCYNPSFLPTDELIRSFVVRHTDLDLTVELLRENNGPSNQHMLVVGPRGIGKTTLVLRVAAEVRQEEELDQRWYPLVFVEESYQVGTAGEFWLEALWHLARQTGDVRWERTHEELNQEQDDNRLRERALAQLMDFADQVGKRILLIVENFSTLIEDMRFEKDAWALRHTLQNEPRIMLLATSTRRFEEFENQGKAMFELFKPHTLHPLNTEECQEVLSAASSREVPKECIRPIEILTGGSPQMLTLVSDDARTLSSQRLKDCINHLAGNQTVNFRSQLASLPAKERKVYSALLRIWDSATARQVSKSARLDVNKTSALLARLVKRGVAVVEESRGRTKYYRTGEPLSSIYHLLRYGGGARARLEVLLTFMAAFYRQDGRTPDASLREVLLETTPRELPESVNVSQTSQDSSQSLDPRSPVAGLLRRADGLMEAHRFDDAERIYRKVTEVAPQSETAWFKLGLLLCVGDGQFEEARDPLRRAALIASDYGSAWAWLGLSSWIAGDTVEAEEAFQSAIELLPAHPQLGLARMALLLPKRPEEAADVLAGYLEHVAFIRGDIGGTVKWLIEIAAAGCAPGALERLKNSPSAEFLEPLVVALQIDLGEDVNAAVEVREVANDIVKQIENRRTEIKEKPPEQA